MKIVYMGTPEFAAVILEAIIGAGHEVAAVVTQTDKPKGRGKAMAASPVKECALSHGIPVLQPVRVKTDEEFLETLKNINPELIVVAAYGQILQKEILNLPKYGCVNVHASLLPKYRGAAPIQWSIIDGEEKTGVTAMLMNEGLDTGDMMDRTEVKIADDETGGSLHDKLAKAGADLIVDTMEKIQNGTVKFEKQDEAAGTYASMLKKSMGCLDFGRDAKSLERLVRGLNPWPGTYTFHKGAMMKIWETAVAAKERTQAVAGFEALENGAVAEVTKTDFLVKCGEGGLVVKQVQLAGKKRMDAASFLAGVKLEAGEVLGSGQAETEEG